MRELISDWYQLEMFEMTRESALGKLVDILEDSTVNLRPLSRELKQSIKANDNHNCTLVKSNLVNRRPQAMELKELISRAKDNHDTPPVRSNHRTTDEVNLINTVSSCWLSPAFDSVSNFRANTPTRMRSEQSWDPKHMTALWQQLVQADSRLKDLSIHWVREKFLVSI